MAKAGEDRQSDEWTASRAQGRLVRHLRLDGAPASLDLADLLDRCSKSDPCRSAACPVCGVGFQRAAVSVVGEFICEPARELRGRMSFLTIVPDSGCILPGELSLEACWLAGLDVLGSLEEARLAPAIIALEVAMNEDPVRKRPPFWAAHAHVLALDWPSEAALTHLRSNYPRSERVKRPVFCEPFDGDPRAPLYAFKPQRERRVQTRVTDDPVRRPYLTTKDRPLRPEQAVELAIVEHDLGFRGRLLTHIADEKAVSARLTAAGWPRDGP